MGKGNGLEADSQMNEEGLGYEGEWSSTVEHVDRGGSAGFLN